jgi:hypothetical protein
MTRQKTAVVDFDNTISGYDKWRGEHVMGPIIPFAKDALMELNDWGWRIVVFTTRGNSQAVYNWLELNGLSFCKVNSTAHNPPGTSQKPIGDVYFDDRDAHCVGEIPYNWHKAMAKVRSKYQPKLDTFIDDAAAWSHWTIEWFVAPKLRESFAKQLPGLLDAELQEKGE